MAVLNPIGVDQTTGQSRSFKDGDSFDGSTPIFDFLNIGSATDAVATGDLAAGDAASGGLFYDASAVTLQIGNSVTIGTASIDASGALTVGGTTATALTLGRSALGVSTPGWMNVGGTTSATAANEFAVGADNNTRMFYLSTGRLLISKSTGASASDALQIFNGSPGIIGDLPYVATFVQSSNSDAIGPRGGIAFGWTHANGSGDLGGGISGYKETSDPITGDNTSGLAFFSRLEVDGTFSTLRWRLLGAGHFIPHTTGVYDLGTSSNRIRDIYYSGSLSGTGDATFDFLNIGSATSAVATGDLTAGDGTREWSFDASAGTVSLTGINAAGTHHLVQGNFDGNISSFVENLSTGTSAAAIFRARNDASNDVYLASYGSNHSTNANLAFLFTNNQELHIGTAQDQAIIFETFNVSRWQIQNNTNGGHFVAITDNTYDIGNSGAFRPRTAYFGTDVIVDGAALPRVLSRTASIDLTATGDTAIYTVPTGQSAIITRVVVQLTAATGAAGDTTISVGTNASTYDDIVASTTLTGLDATTESFAIDTAGNTHIAVSTEVIRFQIDSADSTATALTATVHLIGFLF